MGNFPIAERIRHGEGPYLPPDWPESDTMMTQDWPAMLNDCVLFDISTAADLYWHGRKDSYRLDSDFGPIRPPYPHMWMEWEIPTYMRLGDELVPADDIAGVRHGAMVVTLEDDGGVIKRTTDDRDVMPVGIFNFIQTHRNSTAWMYPVLDVIAVDPGTGHYIPESRRKSADRKCADYVEARDPDLMEILKGVDNNTVFMALNLLNCRNVVTDDKGVAFTRSGREKRQRVPVTRYHTIVLPGLSRRGAGGRRSAREEAVMAAHRVRGHFKTYTAERPLMGKHAGTYWWGWNTRGSKKHGEVISDYKFKQEV